LIDDAHIFCLPTQIAGKILGVLNLTEKILSDFGFKDYEVNLSTRPDQSVGTDQGWEYIEDQGGGRLTDRDYRKSAESLIK
jgi:threonyl-tRNA synthetase